MNIRDHLDALIERWGGRRSSIGNEPMYIVPAAAIERLLTVAYGPLIYDEHSYLAKHPDVAESKGRGHICSGLQHFLFVGMMEFREVAQRDFSKADYLAMYPDIKAAIASGAVGTAYDHWVGGGWIEGRLPKRPE